MKFNREGLETYLAELAGIEALSEEESRTIFQRASSGEEAARERIVLAHLPLVVKIAYRYVGYGLPLADLVSEGNIGLMRAAELFDPRFGVDFSTYAGVWIKQRIHRAITGQAKVVRIPVWRSQRLRKLDRLHAELNAELGRDCDLADIAEHVGSTEESLQEVASDRVIVASLESDPETQGAAAVWADESSLEPSEHLSREELLDEIAACLHGLDDQELQILSLKFGLLDQQPESYRAMAGRFGKSREWIRRIGEGALAKVRESFHLVEGVPRSLVRSRQEQAYSRLRKVAAKEGGVLSKLSLFPAVLMQGIEPYLLLL